MRWIHPVVAASLIIGSALGADGIGAQNAQNEWEVQVRRFLQEKDSLMKQFGATRSHEISTGRLNQGATSIVNYPLQPDVTYIFAGVCDVDCSDLDFTLLDENGIEVDSDVETDDEPIVRVTPKRAATFRLRVRMATCGDNPCYYGVGVYK